MSALKKFFERPSKGVGRYSYELRVATFLIWTIIFLSYAYRYRQIGIQEWIISFLSLSYPFIIHFILKNENTSRVNKGYFVLQLDAFFLGVLAGSLGFSLIPVISNLTGVLMNSIYFRGFKKILLVFVLYLSGLLVCHYFLYQFDITHIIRIDFEEAIILIFSYSYFVMSALFIYKNATKYNNTRLRLKMKNKEVSESLRYAKKIQRAVLKSEEHDTANIPEHFVYFKSKNLVSGDFYWALEKGDFIYIAVGDCSTKNVSGAFLTMLGIAFLDQINSEPEIFRPNEILDQLHKKFVNELGENEQTKGEGMEISLLRMNYKTLEMELASTQLTTYLKHGNDIIEITGTEQSIGATTDIAPYQSNVIKLVEGDLIYLLTSGIKNEIEERISNQNSNFKFFLRDQLSILPVKDQKKMLYQIQKEIQYMKGGLSNDCCLIGLKV